MAETVPLDSPASTSYIQATGILQVGNTMLFLSSQEKTQWSEFGRDIAKHRLAPPSRLRKPAWTGS